MFKVWTKEEDAYIKKNASKMNDTHMAAAMSQAFGRTITRTALAKHRKRIGLTKSRGRGVCKVNRGRGRPLTGEKAVPRVAAPVKEDDGTTQNWMQITEEYWMCFEWDVYFQWGAWRLCHNLCKPMDQTFETAEEAMLAANRCQDGSEGSVLR